MAECYKIPIKHKKVCIGDMRHRVTLIWIIMQSGSLTDDFDANLDTTQEKDIWAAIDTLPVVDMFNGANIQNAVSHFIYIRWFPDFYYNDTQYSIKQLIPGTTDQYQYYDVQTAENFQNRSEFILLKCILRGKKRD